MAYCDRHKKLVSDRLVFTEAGLELSNSMVCEGHCILVLIGESQIPVFLMENEWPTADSWAPTVPAEVRFPEGTVSLIQVPVGVKASWPAEGSTEYIHNAGSPVIRADHDGRAIFLWETWYRRDDDGVLRYYAGWGEGFHKEFTEPAVYQLEGHDFGKLLGRLFENWGYKVWYPPLSGDRGVDLILEHVGRKIAVQVKHWMNAVGPSAVQEVLGGKIYHGCDVGVVIATNIFTEAARDLAKKANVLLIDRHVLARMFDWQETEQASFDQFWTAVCPQMGGRRVWQLAGTVKA